MSRRRVCVICIHIFSDVCVGDGRTHVFADLTAFEEALLDSTISIVLDAGEDDNVIMLSQHGSSEISSAADGGDALSICMQAAKERKKTLLRVLGG